MDADQMNEMEVRTEFKKARLDEMFEGDWMNFFADPRVSALSRGEI